jgi:ATP-binding cassette subfamily B protein
MNFEGLRRSVRDRWDLIRLCLSLPGRMLAPLLAVGLAASALPLAVVASIRHIVGHADAGATSLSVIGPPFAVFVVAIVLSQLANQLGGALTAIGGHRLDAKVRARVLAEAGRYPGVTHLESEEFRDNLTTAAEEMFGATVGLAAVHQVMLILRYAGALAACAYIAVFSWPLALVVLVVVIALRAAVVRVYIQQRRTLIGSAVDWRAGGYWAKVALTAEYAKEVRIFGLSDWAAGKYEEAKRAAYGPLWRVRSSHARTLVLTFVLCTVSTAAVLFGIGLMAEGSAVPMADLAAVVAAFWAAFGISQLGPEAFSIESGLAAVRALRKVPGDVMGATGPVRPLARAEPLGPPLIEFDQVGFTYPGGPDAKPVLAGLDFRIEPGETVAVVGRNGAGKTTLIKLLGRLYEPTAGAIRADGVDLREQRPEDWRDRLSVVFQEGIRYPLTAGENIALGYGRRPADAERVRAAVRDAGIEALVDGLPRGLDTPLLADNEGGVALSGGQWQRLFLARAFYAIRSGAGVLVLDEPTAHLDPEAEAAVVREVLAHRRGATVIVISHRPATVRMADRVLVIDEGRVGFEGAYAEVGAGAARYAALISDAAPAED